SNVRLQHPAFFPCFVREVMVLPTFELKSRERHIAVVAPIQRAVGAKAHSIITESSRNFTSLIEPRTRGRSIHHLLQAHNVCVQPADYFDDSLGKYPPVESLALVDVVGRDPEADFALLHCCRSKI